MILNVHRKGWPTLREGYRALSKEWPKRVATTVENAHLLRYACCCTVCCRTTIYLPCGWWVGWVVCEGCTCVAPFLPSLRSGRHWLVEMSKKMEVRLKQMKRSQMAITVQMAVLGWHGSLSLVLWSH